MKIEKIYFDLDGVLADFSAGLWKYCGIDPIAQGALKNGVENPMWEAIKKVDHFFDKLVPMPEAIELFEKLSEKYNCEILSAIPRPHRGIKYSEEDKRAWVKRYLGPDVVANIVFRSEKKQFCRGAGLILIDDYQKNVDEWNEGGGFGILYDGNQTVIDAIEKYIKG